MAIRDKIDLDYKNSLKLKDKIKISTYRLILSGIKELDIANRSGPQKKETDDNDIKKMLKKMIKQRSESIEVYKKNNRDDLLQIEKQEQEILSSYLPKQIDPMEELIKDLTGGAKVSILENELGESYQLYKEVNNILEMDEVQMRMPYFFEIN